LDNIINEKEEKYCKNEIIYYASDTRHFIIKFLLKLINNTQILFTSKDELENLMSKFTLNIYTMNFEEAKNILEEAFKMSNVYTILKYFNIIFI
jgi:hypothetical protein